MSNTLANEVRATDLHNDVNHRVGLDQHDHRSSPNPENDNVVTNKKRRPEAAREL